LLAAHADAVKRLAIFDEPEKACGLLIADGFKAGSWKPTAFGWACSSTNAAIDYIVSGDDLFRAKRVKLMLHLDPSRDREAQVAEFNHIAADLLLRLELRPSEELGEAIRTTRQLREAQIGANITFDPGMKPFTRQVLIIRDPSIRVVTLPRP